MFLNKLILFSPVQWVSKLIVRKLVKTMNIKPFATRVITGIFHNSIQSIRQVGLFPTLTALRTIRLILKKGVTSNNGIDFGSVIAAITIAKRNKTNVTSILGNCIPDLFELIKHNHLGFTILYDFFFTGFFLYMFKPLIMKLVRWSLGLILSSVGIIFNEVLINIPYLNDLANYVVSTLESHTNFRIPRFTESTANVENVTESAVKFISAKGLAQADEDLNMEGLSQTGLVLYVLGILLAGFTTIIAGLIIVDHYNHDLITNTPIASEIVQSTYSVWDSLMRLIFGNSDLPPATPVSPASSVVSVSSS